MDKKTIERSKALGHGWTLLEWRMYHGFSITMHTDGVFLRKRTNGIPHGKTDAKHISLSWIQTVYVGFIEAKGPPGTVVKYTYSW